MEKHTQPGQESRPSDLMKGCKKHENHDHTHGPDCGHPSHPHGNHVDYEHDGHRHYLHGDHWDECPGK